MSEKEKAYSKNISLILLILFFFSGTSALIYQVIWVRMFGLVFGVTVFAVSTVLTCFMAGLAFGSLYFGRLVDKHKDPLKIFALLQLGIGVFALMFPFLLRGLTSVYIYINQHFPTTFYITSLIKFALSFLLLFVPTSLIGGTLPILSKFFVRRLRELGWNMGRLYSVNNLGAAIGCFGAGFFLLETLGVKETLYLAGIINIFIAGIVLMIWRHLPKEERRSRNQVDITHKSTGKKESSQVEKYPQHITRLVLWIFAIEGFCTLAYEVIWIRILVGFTYEKSIYLFTIIVVAFIFGLSLGSIIIAKFIDYKKNLLLLLGIIEIAIGISAVLILPLFESLPQILKKILPSQNVSFWTYSGMEYLIFFLLMLLPTTLMGMTFPLVSKIYTVSLKELGRRIGKIGCLDTVGSIFGAFVAGFIFIPFFGILKAAVITAILNIALGALLVIFHPFMKLRNKLAIGMILVILLGIIYPIMPSREFLKRWQTKKPSDILLFYKEGADSTVAVSIDVTGIKRITINGSVTAYTDYADLRVHKMLAYLPLLLQRNPKKSLVIGLGMGVTAQCLVRPTMEEIDVVEISPVVVEAAAKSFTRENEKLMDEDIVSIIIEDGRNHLLITKKEYDIITSNAVHVRHSGNIYTRDFYQLCKEKLSRKGVMCQWLPINWLSEAECKMLIKSFLEVFPNTSLWLLIEGQAILIGTPDKLQIDFEAFNGKLEETKTWKDLKEIDLASPFHFLSRFIATQDSLSPYVGDVPSYSDNHPYVEFSKVVSRNVNRAALKSIMDLKEDLGNILVNLGERAGDTASIKGKLRRYSEALDKYIQFRQYQWDGNLAYALNAAVEAVEKAPTDPFYRWYLGNFYAKLKMKPEAAYQLKEVIRLNPTFTGAFYYLGMYYASLGRYQEAEAELRKSIQANPQCELCRQSLEKIKSLKR